MTGHAAAAARVTAAAPAAEAAGTLVTDAPLAHLRWAPAAGAHGRPVLLLHGIGGGRQAWGDADQATGAALAAAGFTVLAVDFPGYGLSSRIEPFDLAGLACKVVALVDSSGLGPAVLVGHSMGGMVAQEVAATAPQAVAGLVLASTSPAFGKPGGDWQTEFLRSRCAPLDAGLGMAGLATLLVPTMVAPSTAAGSLAAAIPAAIPAGIAAAMAAAMAMMAAVPEATYRSAVAALVSFDRRANLPLITVPTLVITGEHDRTAAPEVARRMAERIAGAQAVVVPGAGHLLPIEQPQAFHAAVLAFLAAHPQDR